MDASVEAANTVGHARAPNRAALAALLLLILVDAMGVAMLAPILSPVLLGKAPLMMMESPLATRQLVFGIVMGLYSFLMLVAAPVLGDLSDQHNRKRVLVVCAAGVLLSNIMVGWAIASNLVGLLLAARIIGGATAGSQAAAQAAVLERTAPGRKAFFLSMCLLTSSMGFVLGPMAGSIFCDSRLVRWFRFDTAFYFAALLSLVALLLIVFCFKSAEPAVPAGGRRKVDFLRGFRGFAEAFRNRNIRGLCLVFMLMQIGWGGYFMFAPEFLIWKFNFQPGPINYYMSILGLGFCVAYAGVIPFLVKRFPVSRIAAASLPLLALLILAATLVEWPWEEWIFVLPIAITVSVGYGTIITMFSDLVRPDQQGWILGIATSVVSFSLGVVSLVSAGLSVYDYAAPMYMACLAFAASWVLILLHNRRGQP